MSSSFRDLVIGAVMYVVNAADLPAMRPGNKLVNYADDTYVVIQACNVDSREREISNIEAWSRVNNSTMNQSKSAETSVLFDAPLRKNAPYIDEK